MPARLLAVLALGIAALFPGAADAQDPVALYPENYRVLLENDRVRVIDFQLKGGATEKAHHHRQSLVYVLEGFRIRSTSRQQQGWSTGITLWRRVAD